MIEMEWRRCGARQGFPEQLIIWMIRMMVKMLVVKRVKDPAKERHFLR